MGRLIALARTDNADSLVGIDDHVALLLAPGDDPAAADVWKVNSRGFKKAMRVECATCEFTGRPPGRPGAPAPLVEVERDAHGWTVRIAVPFDYFGQRPAPGDVWSANVWRNRSLYANDVTAHEQREAERIDWSGALMNTYGSVRLHFDG